MTDLRVYTWRPSELLLKAAPQGGPEALELAKCGRFNGKMVLFWGLSEVQLSLVENAAASLGLQNERCEQSRFYDNCFHPSDPYECGAHQVELDMWTFMGATYPRIYNVIDQSKGTARQVRENSPHEALLNRITQAQAALASLRDDSSCQELIARHKGYLDRVYELFPSLTRGV